jgi:hypothetical protein
MASESTPLDTSVLANRIRGMAAFVARGAIGPDDCAWFARSLEARAAEIDALTAERDRLAACVERVRGVATSLEEFAYYSHAKCTDDIQNAALRIRAALEGT